MSSEALFESLTNQVKGSVAWGQTGSEFCEDFGRNSQRKPHIVVHVTCETDIVHTLRLASEAGRTVTVRGSGHSCDGQSITDDVLLVNRVDDEDVKIQMLDDHLVSVPTRYPWFVLEKKLNQHGRMFAVLTDNLHTTIGGTLSVGGFGIRSAFHGAQVDQVERLKLILPSGEVRWCSREENSELFSFSLAGFSTLGVIETVVLRTVPWEEPIVYRRCDYATIHDLETSITDGLRLLDDPKTRYLRLPGFPTNHGPIPNVPIWLEWGQEDREENYGAANTPLPTGGNRRFHGPQTMSNFTFVAHDQDQQYVASFDEFAKVWCDFFFPVEDYAKFLPHFQQWLGEQFLAIIYVMYPKRPADAPHIPLHPVKETGRQYVSLGVDFIIPPQDKAYIEHARGCVRQLLQKCLELGGRPYLYGVTLDDAARRQVFGSDYERLRQLKAELDPNNILSSPLI